MKKRNTMLKSLTYLFAIVLILANNKISAQSKISVTANFSDKEISSMEKIKLNLNRSLTSEDGRLAVFVGTTDIIPILF